MTLVELVNLGFAVADFPELADFLSPNGVGDYEINRPVQLISNRHLPRLRRELRNAIGDSFRQALGPDVSEMLVTKQADEWMLGARDLPQGSGSKRVRAVEFGGGDFLRIDTSSSDKDITAHFKKYLGKLAKRSGRKRNQRTTVPTNFSLGTSIQARLAVNTTYSRSSIPSATKRDSFSLWTNLRVLPCMDLMFSAAMEGKATLSNSEIGDCLHELFGEEWSTARVATTQGRISEVLAVSSRLYEELK